MKNVNAEKYMELALKEAKKAYLMDEVPIGAVIVKDNKVIARAHNLKEKNNLCTSHAELLVIQKASKKIGNWNLKGCELYVTLEPCMMCIGTIINSRIDTLYFGTSDPKGGSVESLINIKNIRGIQPYPKEIYKDILHDECSGILKEFFREKRKKKKGN